MNFSSYITTSYGPRLLPNRPMLRVTLTRAELFAVVRHLQRDADAARAAGNDDTAIRLDWRAADLREAAR
jgi:hypothetical protein